jgi:bifunctional non-homologous end joining protein LigD
MFNSRVGHRLSIDRYGRRYHIFPMLKRSPFITPSAAVLKSSPPSGDGWIHEVKFDGWRAQLHKSGDDVVIFTRNGADYTRRFPAVRDSVLSLPVRSAIIDAEIVVCDSDGKPDFNALMEGQREDLCAWCFDLLELNGAKERQRPLIDRKALLRQLLIKADDHVLRYSDAFANAEKLLAVATKQGLEGIVSKKSNQRYVSGKNPGWIKVKTATWRAANRDRFEMFQKTR